MVKNDKIGQSRLTNGGEFRYLHLLSKLSIPEKFSVIPAQRDGLNILYSTMENPNPFHGLRTCIYRVDDINKAKAWYNKILGALPYFDEPFYVGYNVGGYELGLQPLEADMPKRTDNVMTYWGVDDVPKKFKELIEAGARMHEKPQNVGGDIVVASVKDPWDNVIGIIYNPEFKLP